MADRQDQDLVVTPGQFCYLLDQTKGNIDVLVGPFKTSLSQTDTAVRWESRTRTFEPCSQSEAKQQFITASEGEYVVLENPNINGNVYPIKGTRSNAVDLSMGYKINISGPCSFALFPGQSATIVPGHHLRTNQYLSARVYNDKEGIKNWKSAVVLSTDGSEIVSEPPSLHMGQLLIIKGTDVSFYIPPSGLEILLDENNQFVRNAETLERLEFCILLGEGGEKRYVIGPDVVFPEPTETFVAQAGARKGRAIELNAISGVYVKVIAQYTDNDGTVHEPGDELFITGKEVSIYYPRPEHSLIKYGERIISYAVAIPEGEGRYVLNRISGEVRIEHGPSMFLPDPRKEVVVRRILSDGEVSLLYPGNDEALTHNRMLRQSSQINGSDVPMASMTLAEDIDTTFRDTRMRSSERGRGYAAAAVPQVAAQMMSTIGSGTSTRGMPVAASSMSNVSYAATASSAENAAEALVGGGVMQRKMTNTPPRTITLDTKYDGVVSVDVWTGYAALLVRKNGERRVVVGPQTVLLEYDERPMMLELSSGTPKTDTKKLKTGFLRVLNNAVSDQVTVESSDSFRADITLRYYLNFTGESPEAWFNVENYVQFLAERTRSMIRRAAKKHSVRHIRDNAIDIVRTLILGESVEGVGRPGRLFEENRMFIFDLDVETPVIQGDIDRLLRQTEQERLRQDLELDSKERELLHQQRLEVIQQELVAAAAETRRLKSTVNLNDLQQMLAEQIARVTNDERVLEVKLSHQVDQQAQYDEIASRELSRSKAEQDLEIATAREHVATAVLELKEKATAVTPQLTEVLQRLGDEAVLEKIAQSMAPLAILGGTSVVDVLKSLLGDAPAAETLTKLLAGFAAGKVTS